MTLTADDVEALFQGSNSSGFWPRESGENGELSEEEKIWRTLQLRQVGAAARQAGAAGSDELVRIAEKIGDGSRDASWREVIGDSDVLHLFLDLLPLHGKSQLLEVHTLRIIGNSCADTDANRARVVESGIIPGGLLRLLGSNSLLPFVIPVIYNICVDYEPTKLQASKAGYSNALVQLVGGPRLDQCPSFLNIICKILGLLVTQEGELDRANPATPYILLSLATNNNYQFDMVDMTGLTSIALAYLAHEPMQQYLLDNGGFELLQRAFYGNYTRYDLVKADPEEAEQLKQTWTVFVQVLADIAALPSFPTIYPVGSSAVSRLVAWLAIPVTFTPLQLAACLVLGNLARSDETSVALVGDVYPLLVKLLTNSTMPPPSTARSASNSRAISLPAQLLNAALSFLKNLAISSANKSLIGGLLDPPNSILPRLWSSTDGQSQNQFAAISLTRLLVTGCPENVRRICAPLSADPDSPAHVRSNVHVLIDLWHRVNEEPSKMELARAIAAICRVLHSSPVFTVLTDEWYATDVDMLTYTCPADTTMPSMNLHRNPTGLSTALFDNEPVAIRVPVCDADAPEDEKRRAYFHANHMDMATPLASLITQNKFPTLRSEVLFVFALMSRAPDGSRVVNRVFSSVETAVNLVTVITGRDILDLESLNDLGDKATGTVTQAGGTEDVDMLDGLGLEPQQGDPQQAATQAKIDRENGLVMVAEMLRNFSEYMPPLRKAGFKELLAKGGELVVHGRQDG